MTTHDDKTLLELAAKAAEIPMQVVNCKWWNPLTDNADAFCLAVQLNIEIHPYEETSTGEWSMAKERNHSYADEFSEKIKDNDIYAATRRAIVRAAAEIGKTL